jgi:hypothetical protein
MISGDGQRMRVSNCQLSNLLSISDTQGCIRLYIVECRDLNFSVMSFDFLIETTKRIHTLLLTTSLENTKTTFIASFISLETIIALCKRFFFTNIEKVLSVRLPESYKLQQCLRKAKQLVSRLFVDVQYWISREPRLKQAKIFEQDG